MKLGSIEHLVQIHIINNWEVQDESEHLKTIRDQLLQSKQSVHLLQLYQQIWQQQAVVISNSLGEQELILSGLVVDQQESLRVQNRIYASIFDQNWIDRYI